MIAELLKNNGVSSLTKIIQGKAIIMLSYFFFTLLRVLIIHSKVLLDEKSTDMNDQNRYTA